MTIQKFALVTGGSRGIGKAISQALAKEGYHVLVNFHSNLNAVQETVTTILSEGGAATPIQFDVSSQSQTEKALEEWQAVNQDAYIEVIVNNAGIRKDSLMMWMTNEDWNDVMKTSIDGFFFVTRFLLKNMLVKRNGRIINIVSLSGIKGMQGQTNYSAAKAAVIGATKALAQEVAKRKITVNAIAPGFIHTEMTEGLDEAMLKKMIPMERFGEPKEVASLVAFLASSGAAYITGEVIHINGGLYT